MKDETEFGLGRMTGKWNFKDNPTLPKFAEEKFRGAILNCDNKEEAKVLMFQYSNYLIQKHSIKTIRGTKREMFVYKDGTYIDGEDILKKEMRELLEEGGSINYVKEIVEAIKDLTITDREDFKAELNLVNLANGVLDLRTGKLLPHEPQYLFFTKIPVAYKPDAVCPAINKYLEDVLDTDQINIVLEWFGYTLYREYFIKKALILVGEGDTGKTTLINLFYAFVGEQNVSGVSLQKMAHDKFAASNLYNKYINLYDDLSFKDIHDNGSFKIATGNGIITGERKFKDQFQFKNFAKLTFACNKIPDVKDATDDAYFNRWIVVPFTHTIEEENRDKQLIHKMTTPEELSGLLNLALKGLRRIIDNETFSYNKTANEIKTEMMRSASSVARFANDCIQEATGEWISKEDMHAAYTHYASENKVPAVGIKMFGSKLPMCAPYIAEFKPRDPLERKQVIAWRNVKLVTPITNEPETLPEDWNGLEDLWNASEAESLRDANHQ